MGVVEALIILFVVPGFTQLFPELYNINHFPDGYDKLASNLVAGNGYRFFPDTAETLLRTPGYPLFLAFVFYFFPDNLVAVQIANLVLTLAAAWLVALLTQRFTSSKPAAIFASLSFLFHPAIVASQSRGGVAALFYLVTTGFVLILCKAFESQKPLDFIFAGLLLGLATTVKSTTILFPAFLFLCILLTKNWRESVPLWTPRLIVMSVTMFVVLAPWIARNYSLVDRFVPTMAVAGTSATHGLYACKNFSFNINMGQQYNEAAEQLQGLAKQLELHHRSKFFQYFYKTEDEVRFNQYLLRTVYDEYRRSPLLLAECSLKNAFNFWFSGRTWTSTILNVCIQVPFLLLSFLGMFFCVQHGYFKLMVPILAFATYFYLVHLPLIALARYSVPLIPLLAIFCGIAIDELRMRWGRCFNCQKDSPRTHSNTTSNHGTVE